MSEKLSKIDASPEAKGLARDLNAEAPKNEQEFGVLLARYKAQSPEKYEEKLAKGVFARQAKALGITLKSEAKPEKVEAPKEEPKVEEAELSRDELKAALTAKGVVFDGRASIETLKKLLEESS